MKLSREWLSGRLNSLLDSFLFWTVLAIGFSAVGGIALLALALIEGAPIAMSILVGLGGGGGGGFAALEWIIWRVFGISIVPKRDRPKASSPQRPQVPIRNVPETYQSLILENVRWEDRGDTGWGEMIIYGPFCPEHLNPLRYGTADKNVKIDGHYFVRDGPPPLVCLKDGATFTFDSDRKIDDVGADAKNLFIGIRNRIEQTGKP